MKTVQDYLRHAAECEAFAKKAASHGYRKMMTEMAHTWRMLAKQQEEKLAKAVFTALRQDGIATQPVEESSPP